jgi:2-octaprenyl-6-methoxyphenol hydroxylase
MQNSIESTPLLSNYDIVIVGGGIVGQALAVMLSKFKYKIALIDKFELKVKHINSFDNRSIALSYPSISILNSLGVWSKLKDKATFIKSVDISDKGAFNHLVLDSDIENYPFLGAVIEMPVLLSALSEKLLNNSHIDVIAPSEYVSLEDYKNRKSIKIKQNGDFHIVNANYIIACDGVNSEIREDLQISAETIQYKQSALTFNIELKRNHNSIAYERFIGNNVIAMLPLQNNRVACIWVMPESDIMKYHMMKNEELIQVLQKKFGYRLGRFIKVGRKAIFPLSMLYADELNKYNILLFGNAAHFVHPIAGQGFNLCLRDIGALHDIIKENGMNDGVFSNFEARRKKDHLRTIQLTNSLIHIFISRNNLIKYIRRGALGLLSHTRIGKQLINHIMMGRIGRMSTLTKKNP